MAVQMAVQKDTPKAVQTVDLWAALMADTMADPMAVQKVEQMAHPWAAT